jgi:hypothetical protein
MGQRMHSAQEFTEIGAAHGKNDTAGIAQATLPPYGAPVRRISQATEAAQPSLGSAARAATRAYAD